MDREKIIFGYVVKKARQQIGWTQKELATRAKVMRSTIAAIESGRSGPSVKLAVKLAAILKLDIYELFA